MEEKNNYLVHYGVKGMKWGVRRYQNTDGSLTSTGRDHYGVKTSRGTTNNKGISYAGSANTSSSKKEKRDRNVGKALDRTIKRGKDKSNISPAEDVLSKTNQAISNTRNAYSSAKDLTTRSKQQVVRAKKQKEIKQMSNEELQKKIRRLELENRYLNLSDPSYNRGRDRAEDVLDIIGDVVGIAAAGVGIAATIYKMRHSDEHDNFLMHYGVKGMKWKRRKTRFEYSPDGTYKRVAGGNNTWHKTPGIKPAMTRATSNIAVKTHIMKNNSTSSDRQASGRVRVKYIANRMKTITRASGKKYSSRGISVFRRIRRR